MGSTTTYLDLYKPDIGEDEWGALLNGNFDTLDALLGGGPMDVTVESGSISVDSGSLSVTTHTGSAVTLYSSSARTSTPTPVAQTNLYAKGVLVFVRVTAGTAPSVVPAIEVIDPISAATVPILTGTAITATVATSFTYCVYPDMLPADTFYTKIVNASLPLNWQFSMTHSGTSLTYSAAGIYLL